MAFAVLAAVAVGVLVAEFLVDASEPAGDSSSAHSSLTTPSGSSEPAGTPPPDDEATASAPDTAAQTAAVSSAGPPRPSPPDSAPAGPRIDSAALERAVTHYYALLPGDTDTAWQSLGPALRKDGKDAYTRFWSGIAAVEVVRRPRTVGETVVEAELDFTVPGRGVVREVHRLGMVVRDGRVLIDSDELLSSTELGQGS